MTKQDQAFYLTDQIRLCERRAIDEGSVSEEVLMARAGAFAFDTLQKHYPDVRTIAVFCGGGNNAGDGYVLARLAHLQGFSVVVHTHQVPEKLPQAAMCAAIEAFDAGVSMVSLEEAIDSDVELVVDGLLGIGACLDVRNPLAQAIHVINDSALPVLALDVPSGLDADTGTVLGVCIRASVTVTFIARKIGLFTLDGPDHCGMVVCHSLQLDRIVSQITPAAYPLNRPALQGLIAPRKKNSHKGTYGHVLIIGGGVGMPGAVYLAAKAALKVGAGMVSVATRPEYAEQMLPALPEAMIYPVDGVNALQPLLAKATVCVIGPGLSKDEWASELFNAVITAQLPLVIDAEALRLLALSPQRDDAWVLTPHPGEASSLLGCTTAEVQSNRLASALRIQKRFGGCVVLKGVGSLVSAGESDTYLCTAGNPGMATAGMGDVLSGVIGGLLAQGMHFIDAAKLGAWLHSNAADHAVIADGERGLMASDLMPHIRRQLNSLG